MQRLPAVSLGDLTLLRPLAMAGIPAVVVTTDRGDPTLRSRFAGDARVVAPPRGEQRAETARQLASIGDAILREHGARAPLFYGSDTWLELLYEHRPMIEKRFRVLLNEPGVAESLLYKDRFAQLALERGVRVPKTLCERGAIEAELGAVERPVVVKPKTKVGFTRLEALLGSSSKAAIFPSGRALLEDPRLAAFLDDVVVQELVLGAERDLVSFHGFADERGRLLASFCGAKVRAFPEQTGESSCIELTDDDAVEREGQRVAKKLGLVGVFKIDMIRETTTGELFTLEVNARFNLWHHLGAADGINLPEVAYAYLVEGRAPRVDRAARRHRWINLYRDYKSFRARHAAGTLGWVEWARSLVERPFVFEAFSPTDPAPAIGWLGSMIAKRAFG